VLALCENGTSHGTFSVRVGKHGTGKRREGDENTPLGRYGLGDPRPSRSYGTFVPVAYPTTDQRRQEFTGGAVRVHGPDRRLRWLGRFVNVFDTTDGCIGVATDTEMHELAQWLRDRNVHEGWIERRDGSPTWNPVG